jgi:hypothetical protein
MGIFFGCEYKMGPMRTVKSRVRSTHGATDTSIAGQPMARGVVYSQYLTRDGAPTTKDNRAQPPRLLVTVNEVASTPRTQVEAEVRSLRWGGSHWCQGSINPDYIAHQLSHATYFLRLEGVNQRSQSSMPLGFAALTNKGSGVLYVDLVCANVPDRVLASVGVPRISAGRVIFNQIDAFAQQPGTGFTVVTLSAVPDAIGFYDRLGFRLDGPPSPELRQLTDDLRTFRFRSATDFDVARAVGDALVVVQAAAAAGKPLTQWQIGRINAALRRRFRSPSAEMEALIAKHIAQAVADPAHARLLVTIIDKLHAMGLVPHGLNNGVSMIRDVPLPPRRRGPPGGRSLLGGRRTRHRRRGAHTRKRSRSARRITKTHRRRRAGRRA